jgi:predicted nucleotidyltransferase
MATTDQLAQIGDPALAKLVRRLVEIYHPLRIYLFGSHARGDSGPDSDYDLMIVVPDDADDDGESEVRMLDALWEERVAADVLVWKREAFDKRLHLKASFPSTIVREGRLLYAA